MPRTPVLLLARGLILFLIAINIYRAATQSITTDEAYTYNRSVSVPIPELWKVFDANDHVLHTMLCKVSVNTLGLSEFTLRIPSLLGGVLFLWISFRLCRLLFGDGWYMLIAFTTLVLNPLMLDYCSIARGYGLATALLLVSLDQLMRYHPSPYKTWRLYVAGISLALAVAANLTVLLPGIALTAAFATMHLGGPARNKNWPRVRARANNILDHMVVPGVVVTVCLLIVPLLPAERKAFYIGSTTVQDSIASFILGMFWRERNLLEFTRLGDHLRNATFLMAPALLLALLAAAFVFVILKPRDSNRLLLGLLCLLIPPLVFVLHYVLDVPYPVRRTALYIVPLFTLLAAIVLERVKPLAYTVAAVALAQFLVCWNIRYYDEWRTDAGNRQLAAYLRDHPPPDGKPLQLVASFPLHEGARFYRHLYGLEWLDLDKAYYPPDGQFDIYFLTQGDHRIAARRHLRIRYENKVSDVILATPPSSSLPLLP